MPVLIPTAFSEFEFNKQELYIATRFSDLTLMFIQSLLSQAAQRKLELKIELANKSKDDAITEYIQREAEITGEIGAYEYLLMLHRDTESPPAAEASEKAAITSTNQKR